MKKLAFLFAFLAPTQAFAQTCTPEFFAGDSIFAICQANFDYFQASDYCASTYFGTLATVSSAAENDALLANRFVTAQMWIGFTDIATEGTFVWDDGAPVTFTNWNSGEPNNSGGEDCTEMLNSGVWNDINCSSPKQQFACELPPYDDFFTDFVNSTPGYAGVIDPGSPKAALRPAVILDRLAALEADYAGCETDPVAGTFGRRRDPRVEGESEGGDYIVGTSLNSLMVEEVPYTSVIQGSDFHGAGDDGRLVSGHFVRVDGNSKVVWYGVLADCGQ